MLMDQSWTAGKHPLHHVLNALWEFQARRLIFRLDTAWCNEEQGEFGPNHEEQLRGTTAPQTHTCQESSLGVRVNVRDNVGTNLVPGMRGSYVSSKTSILMFFLAW